MRLAADAVGMSLGTCMLILPLYDPLHVAEQFALLDAASGGRAIVGVAPGWTKDEFDVMRLDHGRRTSRFVEGVTLIKRLFTEQEVTFEGRHFQAAKLTLALRLTRKPRPPMWLGGSVESAVRRVAAIAEPELGDTWVASSHLKTPVIIEQAKVFKAALEELGKPTPADFPVLRNIVVAADRSTAIRDAGPAIAESYKIFGNWGFSPRSSAMPGRNRSSRICSRTASYRFSRGVRRTNCRLVACDGLHSARHATSVGRHAAPACHENHRVDRRQGRASRSQGPGVTWPPSCPSTPGFGPKGDRK